MNSYIMLKHSKIFPLVLDNVYCIKTKFEMILNPFINVIIFIFCDTYYCACIFCIIHDICPVCLKSNRLHHKCCIFPVSLDCTNACKDNKKCRTIPLCFVCSIFWKQPNRQWLVPNWHKTAFQKHVLLFPSSRLLFRTGLCKHIPCQPIPSMYMD